MMLYIDNFAGNLRGVKGKLKYLEECGVNCVHLMPFLDSPKEDPMEAMRLRISEK